MKVISNAGPLIALGKLGRLDLLLKLYDEIIAPRQVYDEVVVVGLRLGAPEAPMIDRLIRQGHIAVVSVHLPFPLPAWASTLDPGEIEVVVLAQQQKPNWVLIDNAHARRAARQVGLPLKGTVGLLLEAFRQQHLTLQEFEFLIQEIQTRPELWISDQLCQAALQVARQQSAI